MKKITRNILIAGVLTLSGASTLFIQTASMAKETSAPTNQVKQITEQFTIENMTCATCPISVRTAMKRVKGVGSVEIDFATKIATVTFDPTKTNVQEIAEASTNVGYPATKIKN